MKNSGSLLPLISKILFIVFFTASSIFSQTTYYISSSEGNDSNNGTSESSPWKSLDKLHSSWSQIGAGDKILFKRGDEWAPSDISGRNGVVTIHSKNGTYSHPIIFDVYGSINDPLPAIIAPAGKYSIEFRSDASYIYIRNISLNGGVHWEIYKDKYGTTTGLHHIKFNDFEMKNGYFKTSNYPSGGVSNHVPLSNDPYTNPIYKLEFGDGVVTECAGELDAFNFIYGVRYIDANGAPTTFANRAKINWTNETMPDTNIWIHDMYILNGSSNGELIDAPPGGNLHLIERNVLSGSRGTANVFKMNGEYSQITDCIIRDNEITGSWWDYSTPPLPNSSAFGMIFRDAKDCIVESNTISGRYPIQLGNSETTGEQAEYGTFKNNIIRNNNVYGAMNIVGKGGVFAWGYKNNMRDSIAYLNTFEGNNYWINAQWTEENRLIRMPYDDDYAISTDASPAYRGAFTDVWVAEFGNSADTHLKPQMVNPAYASPYARGNYTLANGSPLINSGVPTGSGHIYDINKNLRTQGVIDVGAYESDGLDIVSPSVTSANLLNETTLLISFSESLNIATAQNTNNYNISNGVTVSNATISGYQVTLTTAVHSSGNFTVTVNNVQDLAGNIISSNNTASYVYNVDTDQPELISVEALSPNSVKILFSEKVQKSSAETITNYSISDGVSIISATQSSLENEVILSTSGHTGGSYTLTVNNILDFAGNSIQANSTFQYNVEGDTVPPELSSITSIDWNTLEVFFSEPVNQTEAEDISNYNINSGISVSSATLTNSTKATLTTSIHAVGEYTLTVTNIHDISGNGISSNNTLSYSCAPKTPGPELLFAFAPHSNIVEVAFSKSVSQSTAENIQNYSISDEINVINVTLKSSSDAVSLEVSELVAEFHYTLTVDNIEDLEGNIISADSNTTVFCYLNNPKPIALYDFTEGLNSNLIYDISCNSAPLHLTISNPAAITWLEGGGMSVNSSVMISSDIASKLNNNCKQTNALTIEAWIKPANTTQNGPARIVSLSNDAFNRNFTLGQGEGTNNTYGYDVRLRTTSTDNNGFPSITASASALTTNLTHVVYTRSSEGVTKIYIDGVESLSTNLGGNLSNWDNSFKLILANEMTGDKPWLGEFHKVAIYDRALDQEEVGNTFTEFNTTIHTNLMVVLEGPYNSGDMATDLLNQQIIPLDQPYSTEPWNYDGYERVAEIPNDIVDWILLELRSNDSTVIAKRAALLRNDGKVVELNGISNVAFEGLASDEYFISVIHRNHIPIISSEKVVLGNHSQLLDLTKSKNVFGEESTANLGNGVYGMYAGDTNCSSIITYSDAMGIVQKNTKSGYNIADVNLSGIVTFADVTHVINNNTKSANFKVNK